MSGEPNDGGFFIDKNPSQPSREPCETFGGGRGYQPHSQEFGRNHRGGGYQPRPQHFGRYEGGGYRQDHNSRPQYRGNFNQGGYRPRFNDRGGGYRGPRPNWQRPPRQPDYSNPYANQLVPREYNARPQRMQHTSRGGGKPSSAFGPCASGASQETLSYIDAFVKPTMLEDPWMHLKRNKVRKPQDLPPSPQSTKKSKTGDSTETTVSEAAS